MSKVTIDVEYIKDNLKKIGYEISDCDVKENNGKYWQLKFANTDAVINIYDNNKKGNTVVNGKAGDSEKKKLKEIIEKLKYKELKIDNLNKKIVDLINAKKEENYYDYKKEFTSNSERGSLLHDIICLSNNLNNQESYLIFGIDDDCNVVGLENKLISNNIHDTLKNVKFAGGVCPEIDVKNLYYLHFDIGVIVCKSSKNVPFYLTEKCRDVNPFHIYTRVGDTNTPKTGNASYDDIKKLWRIHFQRETEEIDTNTKLTATS